jgi:hypothetical protein
MKQQNIIKTEKGFRFKLESKLLDFLIKLITKKVEISGKIMGFLPENQKVKKTIEINIEFETLENQEVDTELEIKEQQNER